MVLVFARLEKRADYFSPATSESTGATMDIHFTVRLAMCSGWTCKALQSWKTIRTWNKVQWQAEDGSQTQNEHALTRKKNEPIDQDVEISGDDDNEYQSERRSRVKGLEHDLLLKWCHDKIAIDPTERKGFAQLQKIIQDPGSSKGLDKFANILRKYMAFDEEGRLAPAIMYRTKH